METVLVGSSMKLKKSMKLWTPDDNVVADEIDKTAMHESTIGYFKERLEPMKTSDIPWWKYSTSRRRYVKCNSDMFCTEYKYGISVALLFNLNSTYFLRVLGQNTLSQIPPGVYQPRHITFWQNCLCKTPIF